MTHNESFVNLAQKTFRPQALGPAGFSVDQPSGVSSLYRWNDGFYRTTAYATAAPFFLSLIR